MTTATETGLHPALRELYAIAPGYRFEMHAWAHRWIAEVAVQEVVPAIDMGHWRVHSEQLKRNLVRRLAMALREMVRIDDGEVSMFTHARRFTARLLVLRETPTMPRGSVRPADE